MQQLSQAQEHNAELKTSESQLRTALAEVNQRCEKAEKELEQSRENVAVASEALRKQLAEKEQVGIDGLHNAYGMFRKQAWLSSNRRL